MTRRPGLLQQNLPKADIASFDQLVSTAKG
jgi:hypothetical protein